MQGPAKKSWRTLPIQERLTHSLVNGISEFVDQDTEEARKELPAPLDVSQSSQRFLGGGVLARNLVCSRRRSRPFAAGNRTRLFGQNAVPVFLTHHFLYLYPTA